MVNNRLKKYSCVDTMEGEGFIFEEVNTRALQTLCILESRKELIKKSQWRDRDLSPLIPLPITMPVVRNGH